MISFGFKRKEFSGGRRLRRKSKRIATTAGTLKLENHHMRLDLERIDTARYIQVTVHAEMGAMRITHDPVLGVVLDTPANDQRRMRRLLFQEIET